jgi:hypothetical protein
MPGEHAFSWNLSPAVNCGPSEILIKQLKRAQLKRAQSEFPFRCSDPEMDGSGHSVDAYQMRSILHSSRVSGCKDTPAQQLFIFSQLTLSQNCPAVVAARQSLCALQHEGLGPRSNAGTVPSGESR